MTTDPFNPLDKETSKAFDAFCVYRDMGVGRSLLEAYKESTKKVQSTQANKTWNDWSTRHNWIERAKAYDAHIANKARLAREDEHIAEMVEYRSQLTKSSKAALRAGQLALKMVLQKLASMDFDEIPVKSLPSYVKAANDTIEKAMDGWGMALAVDDLMELLNDDA